MITLSLTNIKKKIIAVFGLCISVSQGEKEVFHLLCGSGGLLDLITGPCGRGHRYSQAQARGLWSDDLLPPDWRPVHYGWATGTQGKVQQGLGAVCTTTWHDVMTEGGEGTSSSSSLSVSADWPCALPMARCWSGRWSAKNSLLSLIFSVNDPEDICNFDLYCPL